jgi:hypothetical protein
MYFKRGMTELFSNLDYAHFYPDDILIVDDGSLEDHMQKESVCLKCLERLGIPCFTIRC